MPSYSAPTGEEPGPDSFEQARPWRVDQLIAAAAAALSVLLYLPALECEFMRSDDSTYVTDNALVLQGLSLSGALRAFEPFGQKADWIPLTILSHMLDVSLFGLGPAGHHAVNVGLHALNVALLFLLLARGTGARIKSALVTLVFAVHPLQVESVAWVAERKNLLSTLFGLACIAAYGRYARAPSRGRYLLFTSLLAASLMSKAMFVTMPLLLLVLDVFPLARWPVRGGDRAAYSRAVKRLILEKLPLCALGAGVAVMAVLTQRAGGALETMDSLPLPQRLANAVVSTLRYPLATVWPGELSPFYPHPYVPEIGGVAPEPNEVAAAVALLLVCCALVVWSRRRYLIAGWVWYLVALLPVVGLVQLGAHGWADRYAYVPTLGLFVMVVWGADELLSHPVLGPRRLPRAAALAVAAAWLGLMCEHTHAQQAHWRDSIALYSHVLQVTPRHSLVRSLLGMELLARGRKAEAMEQLEISVRLYPNPAILSELAHLLRSEGRSDAALAHYRAAVAQPGHTPEMTTNLAGALLERGELDEGIGLLRGLAAAQPRSIPTLYNLANALARSGRTAEAIDNYRRIVELDPGNGDALFNWGNALALQGDLDGAIAKFEQLRALRPGHPGAARALERAAALKRAAPSR